VAGFKGLIYKGERDIGQGQGPRKDEVYEMLGPVTCLSQSRIVSHEIAKWPILKSNINMTVLCRTVCLKR
jgi:hypothetical protein